MQRRIQKRGVDAEPRGIHRRAPFKLHLGVDLSILTPRRPDALEQRPVAKPRFDQTVIEEPGVELQGTGRWPLGPQPRYTETGCPRGVRDR